MRPKWYQWYHGTYVYVLIVLCHNKYTCTIPVCIMAPFGYLVHVCVTCTMAPLGYSTYWYTCTYWCVYLSKVHIHIHVRTYIHVHVRPHMCTYTCTGACTPVRYTYTYVHIHVHVRSHMCTYTCTYTCAYRYGSELLTRHSPAEQLAGVAFCKARTVPWYRGMRGLFFAWEFALCPHAGSGGGTTVKTYNLWGFAGGWVNE